jgi:hypothetical protein
MENRDVLGWLARVKLAVSGVPCSSPTFVAVLRSLVRSCDGAYAVADVGYLGGKGWPQRGFPMPDWACYAN